MKRWQIVCLCIAFSFAFCFLGIGYAALTDELTIIGNAHVDPPNYDEVVITGVKTISGTTVGRQSTRLVIPTNLHTTFSGSAGQVILYEIKAHNFSKTEDYAYTGIFCDAAFAGVSGKLSMSASRDAAGNELLPNRAEANYVSDTIVLKPGEEVVFYAAYVLTANVDAGELLVNFSFKPIRYSVTYLNSNDVYGIDYIVNNNVTYKVRTDGPANGNRPFAYWMNANAIRVDSFAPGTANDYTLSAKWNNIYIIIFADADGTVLYEEEFTESSTKLSSEGQAIVDAKLAELNAEVAQKDLTVSWSDYDIASATGDITVRAIYNYSGYLNLVPVYELPDDGIVDYYKVMAVDDLPSTVLVPGYVGNIPVKVINRITNIEGDSDWNNYERDVTTIIIEEGVEVLDHNSLSYTPNLTEVRLPSTITSMGKNTFSRNDIFGNDKKKLNIYFNGTTAHWEAILNNSNGDWDGGLKSGTVVYCSDGYFSLGSWSRWTKTMY